MKDPAAVIKHGEISADAAEVARNIMERYTWFDPSGLTTEETDWEIVKMLSDARAFQEIAAIHTARMLKARGL